VNKAVQRVMDTYALMVTLSPEEARVTRERVEEHLAGMSGDDGALAVEGLKFLREGRPARRRRPSEEIRSEGA
jgi:hypothetical protein